MARSIIHQYVQVDNCKFYVKLGINPSVSYVACASDEISYTIQMNQRRATILCLCYFHCEKKRRHWAARYKYKPNLKQMVVCYDPIYATLIGTDACRVVNVL